MSDELNIVNAYSGSLTVTGPIVIRGFLKFIKNDQVIGSLDASFDFTQLPENLHAYAAGVVMRRSCNIYMNISDDKNTVETVAPPPKSWWAFWRK